jgi:hypothetical protein
VVPVDNQVNLSIYEISMNNTFIFLGGTEQLPTYSYTLVKDPISGELTVTFTEPPLVGTLLDIRSICTSSYWAIQSVSPVKVYSLNSISSEFNSVKTEFDLTYGYYDLAQTQPRPLNAASINTQNVLVSLGGAMQIPYFQGATSEQYSYRIVGSKIIFTEAPSFGSGINMRVLTNAEYITCPTGKYGASKFLKWGPSIVLELADQANIINPPVA